MAPALPPLIESLYVGPKLIARRSVQWIRTNGERAARVPGTSFFCPLCNEIWARRTIECTEPNHPEAGVGRRCLFLPQVESRLCEKHADGDPTGGSIVFSEVEWESMLDPYYESHYPLEWLAYELFLIVRRYS